ncbi:glycosyltransferase family 1 protein [Butyrivibrio sp. NC2002]|uniref:glycosyltransferase family 1 protein n=1 Tax=Butyrivibrio sp. NC2002 TaxID=1410610 RepID=UPI0005622927|nr:glycosyltransferase family 1 protein [Butyrivibrio sp. NC2002]
MNSKIKVLHIVGAMYPGGMENFIMNIYENIDLDRFSFDFAVHDIREGGYEDKIKEMGGNVYLLPRMTRHPLKNLNTLSDIIKKGGYDIVIRHTANALIAPQLLVAKRLHAVTVCHSHNETDPKKLAHYIGRELLLKVTDVRLACSENAGKWMYKNRDYTVINNAIDLNKFSFNAEKKARIIKEFNLEGKHIYGHVANFIASKNHTFLLDVFKEIAALDDKAVLICLGEGELKSSIEEKISSLSLDDKVILTGIRHDADAFFSAFDVMLFPSIFEGLPLTLIEAQVSALPMLISDTITPNVKVTDNLVNAMSIEDSPLSWAKKAIEIREQTYGSDRICQVDSIRSFGYDLESLVKDYEKMLTELSNKPGENK